MYAIIKSGTHQYKAKVGDRLVIERIPEAVGAQIAIEDVFMIVDGDEVLVGAPRVAGAKVLATVEEEFAGPKIRVFKYRPKERYRRHQGHRQTYMRLRIDEIVKGA